MYRLQYLLRIQRFRRFMFWWALGTFTITVFVFINFSPSQMRPSFARFIIWDTSFFKSLENIVFIIAKTEIIPKNTADNYLFGHFTKYDYSNFLMMCLGLFTYIWIQKRLITRYLFEIQSRWLLIHGITIAMFWCLVIGANILNKLRYQIVLFEWPVSNYPIRLLDAVTLAVIMFVSFGFVLFYLLRKQSSRSWMIGFIYPISTISWFIIGSLDFVDIYGDLWINGVQYYYSKKYIIIGTNFFIAGMILGLSLWMLSQYSTKEKNKNDTTTTHTAG